MEQKNENNQGQTTQTGHIYNHNHNYIDATPCPGPQACHHRPPPLGAPDAKDENEFFKDTGIRVGPTGRRLLNELKARHGYLRWRGNGSLSRMWQHHTLEYLDGHPELRISYSWPAWIWGWVVFATGVLAELVFFLFMLNFKNAQHSPDWLFTALINLPFGVFLMWLSTEHMISPESSAKRLLQKEAALNVSPFEIQTSS